MNRPEDTPADFFGKETILFPICQCGTIVKGDDPIVIDGEVYCDECSSDLIQIQNQE